MDDAPEEVKSLVLLRRLVTALTAVMIVGFIVLIGFLVTRFPGTSGVEVPASITLPDGTVPLAYTQAKTWVAVVTQDDRILIFDRASMELIQTVEIKSRP